jgi:tol-pal system protein YbgF
MGPSDAVALLLLGCLAASAAGCAVADTGAFQRLQDEMVTLRKEMAAVKVAPPPPAAAESANAGEVQSLRKGYADLNSDFDRVKSDLLAVTSRQDEARVEAQRLAARLNEQERAVQEIRGNAERMKETERRVAALEEKAGKEAAVAAAASPAAAEAPAAGWKSPEEMYEYAVGQVKGGNPKKGREVLAAFASKHPDHKLLPNALYWKGEAFYAEKDFENAILSFQDVVDKYPAGDKAPDATFKQGLSFLSLNDKKNAKILLELVQTKYPKSKSAEMAKKKLAEIN